MNKIRNIQSKDFFDQLTFRKTKNINIQSKENKTYNTNKSIKTLSNSCSQRNFSVANLSSFPYIKKRASDLTKSQIINKDIILDNNFNVKLKGRYLSCSNKKNKNDLIKVNTIKKNRNIKSFFPFSGIRNIEENFLNIIFNVIEKKIHIKKNIFFNKIISNYIAQKGLFRISYDEKQFLEELKGLGVTNKDELNYLIKEIFLSIKGKYNNDGYKSS